MVDKARVGQKIYSLRKKKGITQEGLARLVNVTPQAISKWENGATLPDTGLLPKLAELFAVSMEDVLCIERAQTAAQPKASNKVMLPGLQYRPCVPPLVGCIQSCLDYLGIHVSTGWLSAPYAFMVNVDEQVTFKGPECWSDNGCFDELVRNCGGIVYNFGALNSAADIGDKRREAWDLIRDSIDKGLPCYGWELDMPFYYMIAGYDDIGYYYIDPDTLGVAGPKPYQELGDSEWGCLEIHVIRPGSISDNLKTVKDVFEYALGVGKPDIHRPNEGFTMGIEAYEAWQKAILSGKARYYGSAYNAAFWARCKNLAVLFLKESKLRLGLWEERFDQAIAHYEAAAAALTKLSLLLPLRGGTDEELDEDQKAQSIRLLQTAQRSERKGLAENGAILNEIYRVW